MNRSVRTSRAVEIAHEGPKFTRQKLTDTINERYYPAAPETTQGAPRQWAEADLISLFIFARLVEQSMLPARAGRIASDLAQRLMHQPDEQRHVLLIAANNVAQLFSGEEAVSRPTHLVGSPVVVRLEMDVAAVRELVRGDLAAEPVEAVDARDAA